MKILLINPPQTFFPGSDPPAANLPLGLLYVAAVLDKAGYTTEILDSFYRDYLLRCGIPLKPVCRSFIVQIAVNREVQEPLLISREFLWMHFMNPARISF